MRTHFTLTRPDAEAYAFATFAQSSELQAFSSQFRTAASRRLTGRYLGKSATWSAAAMVGYMSLLGVGSYPVLFFVFLAAAPIGAFIVAKLFHPLTNEELLRILNNETGEIEARTLLDFRNALRNGKIKAEHRGQMVPRHFWDNPESLLFLIKSVKPYEIGFSFRTEIRRFWYYYFAQLPWHDLEFRIPESLLADALTSSRPETAQGDPQPHLLPAPPNAGNELVEAPRQAIVRVNNRETVRHVLEDEDFLHVCHDLSDIARRRPADGSHDDVPVGWSGPIPIKLAYFSDTAVVEDIIQLFKACTAYKYERAVPTNFLGIFAACLLRRLANCPDIEKAPVSATRKEREAFALREFMRIRKALGLSDDELKAPSPTELRKIFDGSYSLTSTCAAHIEKHLRPTGINTA